MLNTLLIYLLPFRGGAYRAQGSKLQRKFGPFWMTCWHASSEAQAQRIASGFNERASQQTG